VGFAVDAIVDRMDAAVRPMNGLLAGAPGVVGNDPPGRRRGADDPRSAELARMTVRSEAIGHSFEGPMSG
jgi:hypothetical protein